MANDFVAFLNGFAIARPYESSLPIHIVVESYGGTYAVGIAKELIVREMLPSREFGRTIERTPAAKSAN